MRKAAKPATIAATPIAAAAAVLAKQAKPATIAAVDTDEGDEGDEGEPKVSQWAREQARNMAQQIAGERATAGKRFYDLAMALAPYADKAKPGQSVSVSYATANNEAGLSRGGRGEPNASWRLFVGKMYTLFALPLGDATLAEKREHFASMFGFVVDVDTDKGALTVTRK